MRLSLLKFREVVNQIKPPEDFPIKLSYLTAARSNELCSISHNSYSLQRAGTSCDICHISKKKHLGDLGHEFRARTIGFTRAVGPKKSDVHLDEYKGIPILTIEMQVLKRREVKQSNNRKEILPHYRTVGLPCREDFDPWVNDILKTISSLETDEPILNLDSWHLNQVIKKYGFYELCKEDKGRPKDDPKKVENPLRHFRRQHLRNFYHLDPDERTAFIGAKLSSIRGASAAEDEYNAPFWTDYVDKLLKPIPKELEMIA